MTRLLSIVWLTVLWVLLWRGVTPGNVIGGLVLGAVATMLPSLAGPRGTRHRLHVLPALRLVAYFCWKLVEANIEVAREVVTPQNKIATGIIAVPMHGCSDLVTATIAAAVSLTPGTLSIEVRPGPVAHLYVHVLHLHDIERSRADVDRFRRMTLAALEPHESGVSLS